MLLHAYEKEYNIYVCESFKKWLPQTDFIIQGMLILLYFVGTIKPENPIK